MEKFDKETRDKMKKANEAFIFFQGIAAKHKPTITVSKEFYDQYKKELLSEEQMRSHSIALWGKQFVESTKDQNCKG